VNKQVGVAVGIIIAKPDVHAHISGCAGGIIKLKPGLGIGVAYTDQRGEIEIGRIDIHRRGPVAG